MANRKEYLLTEWDSGKNLPFTPRGLSYGSKKKLWWRCEKGHQWQAALRSRSAGAGCPYCAGRLVAPGENDLETTHPELVPEWLAEKNLPLTPRALTAGSHKKVWWRCEKGHSWQAAVSSRARGTGCPVCAGKTVVPDENDLTSAFPNIAAEWHPVKNGNLTPRSCTPASNRRVWWICPLGHEYQAAIGARTLNGSGCPYCSGRKALKGFNDLATLEPKIAAQWHPTLNGTLTPEKVTAGSARKAWWQCAEGHVWKAVIHSRTGKRKCGCPVCANQFSRSRLLRYKAVVDTYAENRRRITD